jgi:lysozyme family protein
VTFEAALAFVLEAEGGESNDRNDPGGLTRYGIAQNRHPGVDVASLTLEQAKAIYRRDYWQPIHGDSLPAGLALALFDACVNVGVGRGVSLLQQALGVQIDGVVGSKTLAAALRQCRSGLPKFLARRALYYVELAQSNPRFRTYLHGWLVRCFRCQVAALELV